MVPIASQLLTLELQLHTNSRSMDENLKIQRFEVPPSASDFEFLIESRDVPAVLVGCVKDWRAVSEWNPYNGGLDNLQVVFQRSRCQNEVLHVRCSLADMNETKSHEHVVPSIRRMGVQECAG
ncbi:uncharacterized protein LOC111807652 isoform X2 [Cucurbita pepo subsp. pepo]|uniref:uncharacterized protein LOC111807652 isoform X2 n=1 Tax=Cucurbita pepo subsp. pepo TaxID=3664 RepID=UPI000C9D92CD|nr:uncharacterized protein LOC111807652 isoform X2 [Cucurbita pepo subsp. pepo]